MSIKTIESGDNFKAVSIGNFDNLKNYSLPLPDGELKGKVFLKDALAATACEISVNAVAPKTPAAFLHTHKQNEEIYFVLKGEGDFMVDTKTLKLQEGDMVRVSPKAKRAIANSSNGELIYMVIQMKENSLEQYGMEDAEIYPLK